MPPPLTLQPMTQEGLSFFGKRESTLMAGIAIILMFIHHFFGFDDYLMDGVEWWPTALIGNLAIERIIASFGKFCVHIFAFMSGYVIWKRSNDYTSWKSLFLRLAKFLVCYWIVLVLFWLYALVIGDSLPPFDTMAKNLVGIASREYKEFVTVSSAWYVNYYICLIAAAPLLLKIFSRGAICDSIALIGVFLFTRFARSVPLGFWFIYHLWPFFCSAVGILSAKYAVFERLKRFAGKSPWWISIAGIMAVTFCRYRLLQINGCIREAIDPILVILYIYFFIELFNSLHSVRLEKMVTLLGTHSMNLWFIHSIFFTGRRPLQSLLYAPKYSVLVLFWGLTMCLIVAWAVRQIQSYVLSCLKLNR